MPAAITKMMGRIVVSSADRFGASASGAPSSAGMTAPQRQTLMARGTRLPHAGQAGMSHNKGLNRR
jgi:hypothetical protein